MRITKYGLGEDLSYEQLLDLYDLNKIDDYTTQDVYGPLPPEGYVEPIQTMTTTNVIKLPPGIFDKVEEAASIRKKVVIGALLLLAVYFAFYGESKQSEPLTAS